jgi:hypothetical protein
MKKYLLQTGKLKCTIEVETQDDIGKAFIEALKKYETKTIGLVYSVREINPDGSMVSEDEILWSSTERTLKQHGLWDGPGYFEEV